MDAFVSRKRRKVSTDDRRAEGGIDTGTAQTEEQSTDEKLAILSSIFETKPQKELLEALLENGESVEGAIDTLLSSSILLAPQQRKTTGHVGIQSSLKFSARPSNTAKNVEAPPKPLSRLQTKKGRTLTLYSPSSIAANTPCSIIHNFLPASLAASLLTELLPETTTYTSATFRLFDNIVKSPHTASFYVSSLSEAERQKSAYLYNGSTLSDVREILPTMREVSKLVETAVNEEIQKRIREVYPGGRKLRYQPVGRWVPNAAFVNCYDGPAQSVGWHTDQLSYLGPRPTIGSLSLGVQREFRIRRIVPPPEIPVDATPEEAQRLRDELADAQGQISIPLPHNSLLVMHAEMQEGWKHCVAPGRAGGVTPHSSSGLKRINVTYRWYREEFEPRFTPRCRCVEGKRGGEATEQGVPCVLKSVMRGRENVGRYMWMCQTGGRVDEGSEKGKEMGLVEAKGCGYFKWAEFDDDGVPLWISKERRKVVPEEGWAAAT